MGLSTAVVATGGATCTPGAQTFTLSGGTGTPAQVTGTVNGSDVLAGTLTISVVGDYSAPPSSPVTLTGGGCGTPPTITATFGTVKATLYNNTYASGLPQVPSSPTSFVTTGPGAYTQTTGGNITLFSMTVPGYQLGPADGLNIRASAVFPANTNSKSLGCTLCRKLTSGQPPLILPLQPDGLVSSVSPMPVVPIFNIPLSTRNTLATGGLSVTHFGSIRLFPSLLGRMLTLACSGQLVTADTDYFVLRNVSVNMAPGTN